jgi:A/G-specific adenine glycosylase
MIELGATVCVPNGTPLCENCPLYTDCKARCEGLIDELPVKSAKRARRIEDRTVLLIRDGGRTALHKRPPRGLLSGLFELPNVDGFLSEAQVLDFVRKIGFDPLRIQKLEDAKHIFTHIEWHMIAYDVTVTPEFDGLDGVDGIFLVTNDDLHANYAIPSAFSAYTKYL